MPQQPKLHAAGVALLAGLFLVSGCGGSGEGGAPPSARPPAQSAAAPAPLGTASIAGTIRYEGAAPKLPPIKMDADPGCAKKHSGPVQPEILVLGADNALANVLVRVKSGLPAYQFSPPPEPVVLDQRGCRYAPHLTGVQVGQAFKILNSDELLHNVHSMSKVNAQFNRAMPAAVKEVEFSFTSVETFRVKCDVHPWMNAWVSVLDHPFFAVTGTDGRFEIEGLPAGTYEIEAWHEKLKSQTASVTVGDGEAGSVEFSFSAPPRKG